MAKSKAQDKVTPLPVGRDKVHRERKIKELTERDMRVAYFMLRGHNYKEIAQMVNVKSTQTVWASVQRCLAYWREQMFEHIDEWLALKLRELAELRAEAYAAWERSKENAQTVRTTSAIFEGKDDKPLSVGTLLVPVEEVVTEKGQTGDPRFLAIVDKCIEQECKLLGLYAPQRLALTDPTGVEEFGADAQATIVSRLLQGVTLTREAEETSQPDA